MKKFYLFFCAFFLAMTAKSQHTISVYDTVLFYDGYNSLEALADQIAPVPEGVFRLKTSVITTKLSENQLNLLSGSIRMDVTIKAACDNYDRLGHVFVALVPKDSLSYTSENVKRIEIARFVTPFMDKNKQPDTVPYTFQVDYLQHLFQDQQLREICNFWIELEVFGVPYAANTEIVGCGGRSDVFYGSLSFKTSATTSTLEDDHVLVPVFTKHNFNNYEADASDAIGENIKSKTFTIAEDLEDAQLILITSNHGANSGGEEYNRRWHYIYLNNREILRYLPGRTSCEPFRKYNTQFNGIYGAYPKTDQNWQSFSNWCPGDVIDTRIIKLGTLSAGEYQFAMDVPNAVFVGQQGYFPLSLYLQGKKSGVLNSPSSKKYTISGNITMDGNPLEDVVMGGRYSNTDAAGNYFMVLDSNATITLRPGPTNLYKFTPSYKAFANLANDAVQDFTATHRSAIEERYDRKPAISIYPNPAVTDLHINTNSSKPEDYTVYNYTGQILLQGKVQNSSTINVSTLPEGVYYLRIAGEVFSVIKKGE